MAIYMTQASYTAEAWSALVKNPEDRQEPVKAMMQQLGAKLLHMYYCFGEQDVVVIYEAPDNNTATAAVLAATTGGHMKSVKTTVLFTVEDAMKAMGKAAGIAYPAPKG